MKARLRPVDLLHGLEAALVSVADFNQVRRSQTTVRTRQEVERIVMLSMVAELSGVSITPPELVLELLPHFVPSVYQWRRLAYGFSDIAGSVPISC